MIRRFLEVESLSTRARRGIKKLISRILVDGDYYLDKYEDLRAAGVDPHVHFADHMFSEPLRSPRKSFEAVLIFLSPILAVASALLGRPRVDFFYILKYEIKPAYIQGRAIKSWLLATAAEIAWMRLARYHPHLLGENGVRSCLQDSPRNWAIRNACQVRVLDFETRIPVETPAVHGSSKPRSRHFIESFSPYVAELPNVTGFSRSNIILTECGWGLNDVGSHPVFGRYVSHQSDPVVVAGSHRGGNKLLIHDTRQKAQEIDRAIMLFGVASDAFGHWVPEYLTRIEFYEQHPDYSSLPIIVDEGMPTNHLEYLRLLTDNDLVVLGGGQQIKVSQLIYASPPTFFPVQMFPNKISPFEIGPISPQSYRFLRDRVQAVLGGPKAARDRIFLGRTRMSWRRMTNEQEIADYLESIGFEIVFPELMTFAEQVEMFQRAGCIVAANGSALQNIIFSKTDVKLVILSQTNLVNWGAFTGQVGALGYRPLFVCGPARGDSNSKHADYAIPVDVLESALRSIGEL